MEKLVITANGPLLGDVNISGAKNAALPLLLTPILAQSASTFTNVPDLLDIKTTFELLSSFGAKLDVQSDAVTIDATQLDSTEAHYELVSKMRASILVLGPLLARYHQAKVSLPGGCAIGARPVNLHLAGLEKMGATIEVKEGYVYASAKGGLKGASLFMDTVSVGATENLLMAATLAKGETCIENAAQEPEIVDLAKCLNNMGAKITGAGSPVIKIIGVDKLHGCQHAILPDRIETGTFLVAAAATSGAIRCTSVQPGTLDAVLRKLEHAGAKLRVGEDWISLDMQGNRPAAVSVVTAPHPAFPTDMQAQFLSMNTVAQGHASVTETIFENRFMHVPELVRMGARIHLKGNSAYTEGSDQLTGAQVKATDLRASASLIIAGLVADGKTEVSEIHHLDRGYDRIERKLTGLGASIQRVLQDERN